MVCKYCRLCAIKEWRIQNHFGVAIVVWKLLLLFTCFGLFVWLRPFVQTTFQPKNNTRQRRERSTVKRTIQTKLALLSDNKIFRLFVILARHLSLSLSLTFCKRFTFTSTLGIWNQDLTRFKRHLHCAFGCSVLRDFVSPSFCKLSMVLEFSSRKNG